MRLGLPLHPRVARLSVWLLAALVLLTLNACSGSNEQAASAQSRQQDQQANQAGAASQSDSAAANADAQGGQPQQAAAADQEAQAEAASAADAMQRGQQQSAQPQPQADAPLDPYGSQHDTDQQPTETPVPPIRTWLVEGVALEPSVPTALDEYGWSAVIEGDVIAVSAPYHDVMGENTGAVFIFERIDGEWVETSYLLPPYPDPQGWFGRWLAIDNGRIVIGAPYEDGRGVDGSRIADSGVAYVYEKVNGGWLRTGTLLPHAATAGASFGWSVAISGDRIAVAAWEDPQMGLITGSVTTFTQHKGLWRAEAVFRPNAPGERLMFGRDIELQDNILVVGVPGDDTIAEDAGAVYVWHHYNDQWNFAGKLVAGDGIAHDRLGSQVALQTPWLAAGAYDHDDPLWSAGATYVWKLDTLWELHAKLEASDMQPGDWFGYSVDIQGDRMVVGAPHRAHPESETYRSGAAYAFELIDDRWVEVGVLGPVDAVEAGERAEFGWVTEIDGTTAVVGAWLADTLEGGLDAGTAAVYELPVSGDGGASN